MKHKIIIKILVITVSVFCLISIGLYAYYHSDLYWDKYRKELDQAYAEKNATKESNKIEYRNTKPSEYLALLNEYKYFTGSPDYTRWDYENEVNILCELEIENNFPVLSRIDYYNGEKIIRERVVLNDYLDENRLVDENDLSKGYMYLYSFVYLPKTSTARYWISFYSENGINEFRGIRFDDNYLTPCETKNINEIIAELSDKRRDTQFKYAGLYEFERMEILEEQGTKNAFDSKAPKKTIDIVFTGTGNLHGEFGDKTSDDYFEHDFYMDDDETKLLKNTIEGHVVNGENYYFFVDDYFIYYSFFHKSPEDYFEGYFEGYTLEYKIYYKKRAPGA
jgi:hypothetical protein